MQIKASGRSVLIVATAMLALLSTPLLACESGQNCTAQADSSSTQASAPASEQVHAPLKLKKFTRKRTHTTSRHRRDRTVAASRQKHKDAVEEAARPNKADLSETAAENSNLAGISPEVANARAQLRVDTEQDSAAQSSAIQGNTAAVEDRSDLTATKADKGVQVVAADEVNEIDRAADETPAQRPILNLASLDSHAEMREDNSIWTQTSNIGKMFIAFGAMLTLASAARMLFT